VYTFIGAPVSWVEFHLTEPNRIIVVPSQAMQLSTLTIVSLLSVGVLAKSDLCKDPRVKKFENNCETFLIAEAKTFTLNQIGKVGATTNICQSISGETVEILNNRVQKINSKKDILDILPKKCIKDMVEKQSRMFDAFFKQLDEYQRKSLFKRINMCSFQKKFEGTEAESELKDYCKERKLKDQKEELKDEKAKIESEKTKLQEERAELEKKRAAGKNNADGIAFTAACIFIPIMAAAALL
jgi:hypothetical protein